MKIIQVLKKRNQKKRIKKYSKISKELQDSNFTIISSMCIGGIIYHDLGMEFSTPTINLRFTNNSFYDFCYNIDKYVASPLIDTSNAKYGISGRIDVDNLPSVYLSFPHDNDFKKVNDDWNRRKVRINYNNIHIIAVSNNVSEEEKQAFERIPYKNKILLYGHISSSPTKDMLFNSFLKKEKDTTKRSIAGFKGLFTTKRNFDSFDWVSFLKQK